LRRVSIQASEPVLASAEEIAEYLHRCVNGGCQTLGELKRAVRRARDALCRVAGKGGRGIARRGSGVFPTAGMWVGAGGSQSFPKSSSPTRPKAKKGEHHEVYA